MSEKSPCDVIFIAGPKYFDPIHVELVARRCSGRRDAEDLFEAYVSGREHEGYEEKPCDVGSEGDALYIDLRLTDRLVLHVRLRPEELRLLDEDLVEESASPE